MLKGQVILIILILLVDLSFLITLWRAMRDE